MRLWDKKIEKTDGETVRFLFFVFFEAVLDHTDYDVVKAGIIFRRNIIYSIYKTFRKI